jgi:tetratricopeptide (TPR) repeat protein
MKNMNDTERASNLLDAGKYKEALLANNAILKDRNEPSALHNKGSCLLLLGKYKEALSCYRQLIKQFPNSPSDYCMAAKACICLKKHFQALIYIDKAISLEPNKRIKLHNTLLRGKLLSAMTSDELVRYYRFHHEVDKQ